MPGGSKSTTHQGVMHPTMGVWILCALFCQQPPGRCGGCCLVRVVSDAIRVSAVLFRRTWLHGRDHRCTSVNMHICTTQLLTLRP